MTFSREIDLFDASGAFVRSIKGECSEASFSLSSSGGCGSGALTIPVRWRNRWLAEIEPHQEVRMRWDTSSPYVYAGRIARINASEKHQLDIELTGLSQMLDGLFATDAESPAVERVDFGSSASAHSDITTLRGVALYYLDHITGSTPLVYDLGDIDDDGQSCNRLEWAADKSLRKVLDDLVMFMGAAGDVYRWGVIPGSTSSDPNRLYLKRVSAFPSAVATFWIGDTATSPPTLDRVTAITEGRGAEYHNVVNVIGGIDRGVETPALVVRRVEDATSIAHYGEKRATRIIKSAAVTPEMADAYAQGYLARYALPETAYKSLSVIPSDTTQVPLPWAGKLQLSDAQSGEVRFDEFSEVRVAWDEYPHLDITLGRVTSSELISEADGTVASPNSVLDQALQRLDDFSSVLSDMQITPIEGGPPGGGLAVGTVLGWAISAVVQTGVRVSWAAMIAHFNDLSDLGDLVVEHAWRDQGETSWGATASSTIPVSNRVGSDERWDQRVGPRDGSGNDTGPHHSVAGELAYRFVMKDPSGSDLFAFPASSDADDWPRVTVATLSISTTNNYTMRNYFSGKWEV